MFNNKTLTFIVTYHRGTLFSFEVLRTNSSTSIKFHLRGKFPTKRCAFFFSIIANLETAGRQAQVDNLEMPTM